MTNTTQDAEREAFEADALALGFDLARANNNTGEPWCDYKDWETGLRWGGWLAGALRSQLATTASAPVAQGEPVAWRVNLNEGHDIPPSLYYFTTKQPNLHAFTQTPLYTHPAPAVSAVTDAFDKAVFEERKNFYLEQIKDTKNHAAIAFDLAYCRAASNAQQASQTVEPAPVAQPVGGMAEHCLWARNGNAPCTMPSTDAQPVSTAPDVDALAQEIRRVDGQHKLGAGALAEALMPFLASRQPAAVGAVGLPVVAYRFPKAGIKNGYGYSDNLDGEENRFKPLWEPLCKLSDALAAIASKGADK